MNVDDSKTPVKKIQIFRWVIYRKKAAVWKAGDWLEDVTHFNLKPIIDRYGFEEGSKIIDAKVSHHVRRGE